MSPDIETTPYRPNWRQRIMTGLVLTVAGFLMFVLGASPGFFDLDRSPVIGFVQIGIFLSGLGVICLGGYIAMVAVWYGTEKSILADIGLRLVATGFLIAVTAGMADVFGLGTQPLPGTPLFGPWQEVGVLIGEVFIGVGFLMMIPYRRTIAPAEIKDPAVQIHVDNVEKMDEQTNT